MWSSPENINLPKIGTFSSRITSKHLYIIAFIFLGLLSFSLLITVIVQARKNNNNTNIDTSYVNNNDLCLTRGCISASTHQLRSINSIASSNLCTDFYTYACDGWVKTHPIQSYDVERTILGDIINRRDFELERLLDAPILRTDERSWEYKIKTYYAECLDDYARVPDSGKFMIGLIQAKDTLDGWYLFDNSGADVNQETLLKNQSLYKQMSHIHGDFGVRAVFGIRTRFDENDTSIKRLEFFPAGLTMEVNDYVATDPISTARRAAFQIYILAVTNLLAQEAGINDSNLGIRTANIANDVLDVERFLAESLQRNPTSNIPRTTNLQTISEQFSFNFSQLMAHELGDESVISILTPIYLLNNMYFTDAFEYITNINDPIFARKIHNYLRWRLVSTYIEDLSYNYVHAHRFYLNAYYGYTLHTSNEIYCIREVIRRFPLAIQRLYTMNSTKYTNAITTVQTIFDSLKNGFKEYISEKAKWIADEETKNIAIDKIDKLTASIGYAAIASDDASLDNYYEKFVVSDNSHLENAYSYHRFYRWSLSNSIKNPNLLDHWDFFETRTNRLFDYISLFNRLFIIASGMHEPLVNSQWPWSVNMGSIGVLLAQKLFSSIDIPEGRTHLPNGTRYDWWQTPTIIGYNNSRNCITNYYVNDLKTITYNVNGVPVQVQLAGEPFSPTTLRHIGALRLAYGTLIKNNDIKNFKMPGTNFTSEQTFFLSYAQTQCYQRQELLQLLRTQLGVYDERTALNVALIHMPEFAQAFQCQPKENQCFQ
ncbi:unnamed protein product [Rotaria sp. Silwood1]|nr:unnamed protein product [Rotaria sp. Silwood1]